MESTFYNETLPQGLQELIDQLPSQKVRASFLKVLENAQYRKSRNSQLI